MDLIEVSDNILVYHINASLEKLNVFRKKIMSETPSLTINSVTVWKNTSSMVDEVISSRLGLLPLKINSFDLKNYSGYYTLDVSNHEDINKYVYSKDLMSHDDAPEILYDNFIITLLQPGEVLTLVANVVKGTGKDHVKWNPFNIVSIRPMMNIQVNINDPDYPELLNVCPYGVFDIINGQLKINPEACVFCHSCVEDTEGKTFKLIRLQMDKNKTIVTIEQTGILPNELFRDYIEEELRKIL